MKNRVERLKEYVKGLKENKNGRELYLIYQEEIDNVKPQEAFEIFYGLLEEEMEVKDILVFLDKVINVFYHSLSNHKWEKPNNDKFIDDLIRENDGLVKKMDEIKALIREDELSIRKRKVLPKIEELKSFDDHYLKKENILFPYMEKSLPKFEGLKIMWALHDVVRGMIETTIVVLQDEDSTEKEMNKVIADLMFAMLGLKKKEDLILFPSACDILSERDWYEMHKQSLDYGFPFIEKNRQKIDEQWDNQIEFIEKLGHRFKTETGDLSIEEALRIFNILPVDITFVDENNKVRYFSNTKERIFPRSPAVIGRQVNNCHPPDSVHVVEEIVESFRTGKEDNAKFWIQVKGRMFLIQYFALRDNDGNYKGVLEVSQDVTEIRSLEGERRLLKWNK